MKMRLNLRSMTVFKRLILLLIFTCGTALAQNENLDTLLFKAVKANDFEQVKTLINKGADVNETDHNGASILMWAAYSADVQIVKTLVENGADYNYKQGIIYINNEKTSYYGNLTGIAAGEGKPDMLKYFIEGLQINIDEPEYNPNTNQLDGWTPLQWALSHEHMEIIKYLLEKGANTNGLPGNQKYTPLHLACKLKNGLDLVKSFEKNEADINIQDAKGNTPLHYACKNPDGFEIVKFLLSKGANPNIKNNLNEKDTLYEVTPLFFACENPNGYKIVKLLVENGADINEQNSYGSTPLRMASGSEQGYEIVRYLIEMNADVNKANNLGNTPLHKAARNSEGFEIVKLLVENNADINALNSEAWSPLSEAARRQDNIEILKYLIENGGNKFQKIVYGHSLLHLALVNDGSNFEVIQYLLDEGLNINDTTNSKWTPLHFASRYKGPEIVNLLVSKGADTKAKTNVGYTALHLAVYNEEKDSIQGIIEPLLDYIDINERNNYDGTVLHYAVRKNDKNIIELLLKNNAKINSKDNEGWTPLHSAVRYSNDTSVIQTLIDHGADVYMKADKGYSALHLAYYNKNDEIIPVIEKILLENTDVSVKDENGITALHDAAGLSKNSSWIVKYFIEKGADINAKDNSGNTPLHYAAKNDQQHSVKHMIKNGANINELNNSNANALTEAVFNGSRTCMDYLLKQGAVINKDFELKDSICFDLITIYKNTEIIKIAFLYEPNLNAKNADGKTLLQISKEQGKDEIFEFLASPYRLQTLLRYKRDNEAFEIMKSDADEMQILDENGKSVLHFAVRNNNLEMVNYICKEAAELIPLKDNRGRSALFDAVLYNSYDAGKKLINEGADPYVPDNQGSSAYFLAQQRNDEEWIHILSKSKHPFKQNYIKPQLTVGAHGHYVYASCFFPDSRYILSSSLTTILWDTETGKPIMNFGEENYFKYSIDVSSDGNYALTGSEMHEVRMWDMKTGDLIRSFKGHAEAVRSVSFSDDFKYAVSGSEDNTIILWDTETGNEIRTFEGHIDDILSVCFSPDGKYILSASKDKTIILWDKETGSIVKTFYGHTDDVTSVKFLGADDKIVSCSFDKTIKIWNFNSGDLIKTLYGHTEAVTSIDVSLNGKYIISGSYDKSMKLWDVVSGEILESFDGKDDPILTVSFSPNGKYVLAGYGRGGKRGKLKLWEIKSGKEEPKLLKDPSPGIKAVEFSKNGKSLLVSSGEEYLKVLNVDKNEIDRIFKGHGAFIEDAVFSNNGKYILSGSDDKTVKLWDINTGENIKTFTGHNNKVKSVNFSPDDKYVVSTSDDGEIIVWDINSGKIKTKFTGHSSNVSSACFSPDGKLIASCSSDRTVKLWDIESGREVETFRDHTDIVSSLCFSPDGKFVLSGSYDKTIKLWDVNAKKLVRSFEGHTGTIESVEFSPNGEYILSTADDHFIKMWNVESGECTLSLDAENIEFKCIFHPSGRFILSNNSSNQTLWDANSGEKLASIVISENNDWLVTTPSGLFDATPNAMRHMHFTAGLEIIELNQLKDRYYEPGLLKKIINGEELRDVQGFNDVKLYPEMKLGDVQDGAFNIQLKNRGGGIGKVVIFINGKEIEQDARGESYDEDAEQLNLTKNIKDHPFLLADSNNIIEVKVYNAEGWLVSRGAKVKYNPGKKEELTIPELHIVSIGVSDYEGEQIDLKYAAKDANDIIHALKIGGERLLKPENVHAYLLASPLPDDTTGTGIHYAGSSKEEIINTFNTIKEKAKAGDILVVYLSGHGINYGGHEGDFYYLTADAYTASTDAYNDPGIRNTTALSGDELTELIKLVPALKQVLIIDACASGRVTDDLIAQRDISSSTIRVLDRMKDRTGMHIITGSAADAVSYEAGKYGQGVLTYTLIDGIRGSALREEKFVDVNKLFQYSKENVPVLAKGIGGIQQPQVFSPYGAQSFDIGYLTDEDKELIRLAKVKPVFIRSNFLDNDEFEDVLNLSVKVDELLNEKAHNGKNSPLVFVDVKKYPEAYKLSGTYTQEGDDIVLNLIVRLDEQKDKVVLKAGSLDDLLVQINEELNKIIK